MTGTGNAQSACAFAWPRVRLGIKRANSHLIGFEAQGRFTSEQRTGVVCTFWYFTISFFKLWGKSPNPATESVGCERSNLPASSVSFDPSVEERAKRPFLAEHLGLVGGLTVEAQ